MGNVVFSLSVSLDGFMSGPNGEIDWHHVDAELHAHMNEWLGRTTAFLEGRRTYELMEDYWPTADQQPDATPVEVEFAGIWRGMPKVVYSTTLESASPGTTIKREVVLDEVRALSATGDIVVGGPNLAKTFIALDLVDEVRLYVNPIVLGAGQPMFQSDTRLDFELIESRTFGNGVVLVRYQRV
jgi:dihydrofolate reductase